jgi:DGQHR domain-containing protein
VTKTSSIQSISVLVPRNPFVSKNLQDIRHCLAALSVVKLMEWWPGTPHSPHRDPQKVRAIQRSLDWKRVAQIAAYLLQREIVDVPDKINRYFKAIYDPRKSDPGRQWPPRVPRVVGFERSEFPTFANVLLHVNGASVVPLSDKAKGAARLQFDEKDRSLRFSVIDGQHRINGAFLAVCILEAELKKQPDTKNPTSRPIWEIPAEIFVDLDARNEPPRRQAQIFIDVNFYQKKVDRSLVADLFPTARGPRGPLDDKERAQDLGRHLMLEIGPLVGMIQIPGIRFGVKDVVTLATLAAAIEDVIPVMSRVGIEGLEAQAEFLAQCLSAWLKATGRREEITEGEALDPDNVAYQGRVIVSFLAFLPACIWKLRHLKYPLTSDKAESALTNWLRGVMNTAGLLQNGKFLSKKAFGANQFLGSGGTARFRDTLWAAVRSKHSITTWSEAKISSRAERNRTRILKSLGK